MYHAAANNDIKVVKLLIASGALVRPNPSCMNPIDVAQKNKYMKLELLLTKTANHEEMERKKVTFFFNDLPMNLACLITV